VCIYATVRQIHRQSTGTKKIALVVPTLSCYHCLSSKKSSPSLSLALSLSLSLALSPHLTRYKLKLSRDDKTWWMKIPRGDDRLSLRNNCPKFKNIRNTNCYYGSLFQARSHNREIVTISFVKPVCLSARPSVRMEQLG
jgi:hypothetical protein